LPADERTRAQGLLWLSARWGGAFTPLLVVAALHFMTWRWAFGLFGVLGVVWAVIFFRWFRDRPQDHPGVNAAELALLDGAARNAPGHTPLPWRAFCRRPAVWLLWLQYFCMSYGWYFYVTWLPTYLREARGVPWEKSALLAGLPLFFGGIGCYAGAWLTRVLAVRRGVGCARRLVAGGGLLAAGLLLAGATRIEHALPALLALALASFANDLAMAPGWTACMDMGGRFAGSLSGSMNMMGNFGGMLGPLVVGFILAASKSAPDAPPSLEGWTTAFLVAAALYLVAALAWVFLDPVTPVDHTP